MPSDKTIDYIELPAKDLSLAKHFYSETFGWTFEDYGPDYIAFNDGRIDGGYYRSDLSVSVANGTALIVLYADDLEAMREKVIGCGGTICQEIFEFPGGRRFHFMDPNDNEMAVWSV